MLKLRILTAIILIPLVLLLVFYANPEWFCIATSVLVIGCAFEWSTLMGVKALHRVIIFPLLILFLMLPAMRLWIPDVFVVTAIWWLLAAVLVICYPRGGNVWGKSIFLQGLMGIFTLIPAWLAINFIRDVHFGLYKLLYLFVLIWGADTGAYFTGKWLGKHKMIPAVSPNKTWEGLLGALVVTIIITTATLYFTEDTFQIWIPAYVVSIVTVLFSVLGDLFESMLKRQAGVKDSGRLLPGHGGLLDRIDSLTSAAPIFVLGLVILARMS